MNIFIWVMAGAALGFIGYTYLDFNEDRGRIVSMLIGGFGGYLGGGVLAPMFLAAPAVPGPELFSFAAMFFAAAVAAAALGAANWVQNRWGI